MINGKRIETDNPTEVAKEAFWLAYKSAGAPRGMGFLQARPDATKDDVFQNVVNEADYPGPRKSRGDELHGDYVFGRMLKLRLELEPDAVVVPTSEVRRDYQAWSTRYPSYQALIEQAIENVDEG